MHEVNMSRYGCMFSSIFVILLISKSVKGGIDDLEYEAGGGSYPALYKRGVEAYHKERWEECSTYMQGALHAYKTFTKALTDCRIACHAKTNTGLDRQEFLQLTFFDLTVRRGRCFERCKMDRVGTQETLGDAEIEDDFQSLKPYHYLQMCAYQSGNVELATAACFTYLVAHPGDEVMLENLEFYQSLEETHSSFFYDMEAMPHQVKFESCVEAYHAEDWARSVLCMEQALQLYYAQYDRCAATCEAKYTSTSGHDLYTDLTAMFVSMTECKHRCPDLMATIAGHKYENFLAEHYNYLQFAHYQMGQKHQAMACIATYLLLNPNSPEMMDNRDYYLNTEGMENERFIVRPEAAEHQKKILLERIVLGSARQLLHDINQTADMPMSGEKDEVYRVAKKKMKGAIHASQPVTVEGILSRQDVETLQHLIKVAEDEGRTNTLEGKVKVLSVVEAAEMVVQGVIPVSTINLLLNTLEKSRSILQAKFNIHKPFYFHQTLISCLQAPSDACFLQRSGSCTLLPSQTHQDVFRSLVYLDKESSEGDIGDLAGFSVGSEFSMKTLTRGESCVLASWYTQDSRQQGLEFAQASTILNVAKNQENRKSINSALQKSIRQSDINIIMTEDELNGPERFAADGLATDEQCQELINLANSGGLKGDGYKNSDPLTAKELYAGLTLERAAELLSSSETDKKTVQLYLDLSERGRHLVEQYFKPNKPLYFDYTQLVCRTARDDDDIERVDLSHPIHADNCIIQPDNSCKKVSPAYTQRDYSGLLYLNDDFAGGEFFFAHENMTVQSSLKPKCGRIVGFNAANYHGVKAVLKGQRCAVAMWYTLDPHYKEQAHGIAQSRLSGMKTDNHEHNEF